MASAPDTPGGFGTERASAVSDPANSDAYGTPGASWWGVWASGLAGDNSTTNNEWKADNGYLPVSRPLTRRSQHKLVIKMGGTDCGWPHLGTFMARVER